MEREPIIFVISSDGGILENVLRQRYSAGYRVVVVAHDASPADIFQADRDNNGQIAMFIYMQQGDVRGGTRFLGKSSMVYPDSRRMLIMDVPDLESTLVIMNRDTIDHILIKPWEPADTKLYPVIDELLAEWRASVNMPFVQVRGIMTVRAVRIRIGDTLHRAAEVIALSGIGDLMVIDDDNNFVGVLSVGDVLRAAMPDIEEIMQEGGTLEQAFRLFLRKGSELMYKPVEPLVIRNPLVVNPDDHVAKVAALMLEKNIHRLPVVEEGRLIGTVGRTDICQAVVGTL